MARVIILGTASAVADEGQENTHFVVLSGQRATLVDCPGSPVVRLKEAGVLIEQIHEIILTHFHPDHVSGFPLLLLDLWLLGRKEPLDVYGLAHTIDRAEQMMELYSWRDWPGFFEVRYHRLPEEPLHLFIDEPGMKAYSSPVKHLLPTMGLRLEFPHQNAVLAYSSDTEPSQATVDLARGADVLIHEATGESLGHSSPEQAGEIAQAAGVGGLYLIHYNAKDGRQAIVQRASTRFSGHITAAQDLMNIVMGY